MKQLLLFLLLFISVGTFAQDFSDDFESYTAGELLAKNSDVWTTWSGGNDADDVAVSDAKAASGTNSLYFKAVGAGGPADVILPFGGVLTTGQWEMNMKMFVKTDASGYFNFQGVNKPGDLFAMEFLFYDDGTFGVRSDGIWRMASTYSLGEWIEIGVKANLNLNNWEVYINGNLAGSFKNYVYSIASMDLFAPEGAEFYIDDVSTSYTTYEATGTDIAILDIVPTSPGDLVGFTTEISGVARNLGVAEITSFDISWSYGDETQVQTFSDVSIGSLEAYKFDLTGMFEFQDGSVPFNISTVNANGAGEDTNVANDSGSKDLIGYTPAEDRAVFVEEGTGTWCGWCPRGAIAMDNLASKYGNLFAGIAVHYGDIMQVGGIATQQNPNYEMKDEDYAFGYSSFPGVTGYPSSIIERKDVNDPAGIVPFFFQRVIQTPVATLTTGAEYMDTDEGKVLNVSVTVTAKEDFTEDMSVAVILKEEGVTGTTSDYAQTNYYSSGSQGIDLFDSEGTNWKNLPVKVPASDMIYNHVARSLMGTFWGKEGVPNNLVAGASYTYNFTTAISEDWNVDELGLVAVIFDSEGIVENAHQGSVANAVGNGFVVSASDIFANENIDIYPNPSTGMTFIDIELKEAATVTVDLVTLTGQVVATKDFGKLSGANTLNFNNTNVSTGIYLMKINAGENFITKKVSFIK